MGAGELGEALEDPLRLHLKREATELLAAGTDELPLWAVAALRAPYDDFEMVRSYAEWLRRLAAGGALTVRGNPHPRIEELGTDRPDDTGIMCKERFTGLEATVNRAELKRVLELADKWPLPADCKLSKWWGYKSETTGLEQSITHDDTTIFEQRVLRLRNFLKDAGIPEKDWNPLGSQCGITSIKEAYKALCSFPEFASSHGRGESISLSTFKRKFWREQTICKLSDK